MFKLIKILQFQSTSTNVAISRLLCTTSSSFSSSVQKNDGKKVPDPELSKLSSEEVSKRLLTFFDLPDNWGKQEVRSGRAWRMDELRIKSNADLHRLWYVLYKERNMLLTMEEAAKDALESMASPERIDKVEESMKNIEEVVKERNRAYWQLEVGDAEPVERRRAFRRDIFGRWRWIASSEHLIPYWMNNKWRHMNAPGFGSDVINFNRRLREIKQNKLTSLMYKQAFYCRQLMKRFDNLDLDHLQKKFPMVDVQSIKENLNEHSLQDRTTRFHTIFYQKRDEL